MRASEVFDCYVRFANENNSREMLEIFHPDDRLIENDNKLEGKNGGPFRRKDAVERTERMHEIVGHLHTN